jgi:hypothetical protein
LQKEGKVWTKLVLSLSLLTTFACAQMSQRAQMAAQQPARIDVIPLSAQHALGQPVSVQIQLLDGSGKPIVAREPVSAELNVKQPSGQNAVTKVTLSPGESSKQVEVSIPEAGIAELKIRQSGGKLIGATNYVLVSPPAKSSASPAGKQRSHQAVEKKNTAPQSTKPISRDLGAPSRRSPQPRLIFAAFTLQDPGSTSAPEPQLMLKVSGEDAGGGVRADGKTCARVQVFYTGPDDLARDVQVWLRWSNGTINSNPVIVRKKTRVGTACWTSQFPISAATIQIAATNPRISFSSSDKQTTKFSENIQGIDFANPPSSITVVDNFNLTAVFYDPQGHPVKLVDARDLLFDSSNSVIRVNPQHATVAGGKFDSSTILIPTYFGKSKIEVSTDGYPSATREIRVTWVGALLGSLLGGLLGGWLAFINSGGKLSARIITGLIVGFFASWAYVLVGLPKVDAAIVHNQLSVIFVSLAAGFVGVKAVSVITGKFNFGF